MAHKERIKQMRKKVDVLTMTATPIPRTLNMSLVGIRDMSVIETPPKDRLAIQTNVVKFDSTVLVRAIRTEIARGGQVFFVHNRVESIYSMGNLLQRLVPDARIVIGHGQMAEDALERAMLDFMTHKADILLATTIVENGLDIPNANTIIINRADRYGLAQLYQLRGRVGRSDRAAYAYLLIPPEEALSPVARKRLSAMKEFSELGSGFRVAALDLEIRGAGNLLGGEQSGTIDAVGFEMYMKLLEETIRELKGEDLEDDVRATVNLKVDFRLDDALRARHEPAADDLSPHGRRAQRGRDRPPRRRSARPLRPAADRGAEPRRLRAHPRARRRARRRDDRSRRLDDRDQVPAEDQGRSDARDRAGAGARRPAAAAAELAEARPEAESRSSRRESDFRPRRDAEAQSSQGRIAESSAKTVLVDGASHGRRSDARLHKGRDSEGRRPKTRARPMES